MVTFPEEAFMCILLGSTSLFQVALQNTPTSFSIQSNFGAPPPFQFFLRNNELVNLTRR